MFKFWGDINYLSRKSQPYKRPFRKGMLNRNMVLIVTKSHSMKGKLSYISYVLYDHPPTLTPLNPPPAPGVNICPKNLKLSILEFGVF